MCLNKKIKKIYNINVSKKEKKNKKRRKKEMEEIKYILDLEGIEYREKYGELDLGYATIIEEEGTYYVVVDEDKREFYDVEEIVSLL